MQSLSNERARREFEASEDGRRLKASQLAEARAEDERLAARADLLLEQEQEQEQGLSPDDLAKMPPGERITASGIRGGLKPAETAWDRFERGSMVNEELSGGTIEENAAAAGLTADGDGDE